MAGFADWQTNVQQQQQKAPTGAYTSGGPAEVGSTYGQYTPQSFAQQAEQNKFGPGGQYQASAGSNTPAPWAPAQQKAPTTAQPTSWAAQTASWQTAQPSYSAVPPAQQGYTPTGYAGSAPVQPQTAAPFGGWNQPQAQQSQPGNPSQAIADAYRRYLGREASPQEIAARVNQRGFNLQAHIEGIASSPEAYQNYQRQQQGGNQAQSGDPSRGILPGEMQGSQRPMQNTQNWNTDGYATPGYVAQRPSRNPPAGWDAQKWNDPNHQTPKYVIGRILSQYQPSVQGLAQATQELARAYPGAAFNGKDKVTIPGLGTFDLLANSGSGKNMRWQLGAQGGGGAQQPVAGQPNANTTAIQQLQGLLQNFGGAGGGQPRDIPIQDPGMAQELAAMRAQLAQFQQQAATQQAEATAAQQRARGPQFSYF